METCSEINCTKQSTKRNYCEIHYRRNLKLGKFNNVLRRNNKGNQCSVDKCFNNAGDVGCAKGYCVKHYKRWKRHGDPTFITRQENGCGTLKNGYKVIRVDNKSIKEHRHIMEQAIGRKLYKNEVVHHCNGDRLDNRVENLEIMTRGEHSVHHRKHFRGEFHKQCSYCKTIKPRWQFGPNYDKSAKYENSLADANTSHCRICACLITKKSKIKNRSLPECHLRYDGNPPNIQGP